MTCSDLSRWTFARSLALVAGLAFAACGGGSPPSQAQTASPTITSSRANGRTKVFYGVYGQGNCIVGETGQFTGDCFSIWCDDVAPSPDCVGVPTNVVQDGCGPFVEAAWVCYYSY
jgi:hypothetical protein